MRDSLFAVAQCIPELPVSIAKEEILLYGNSGSLCVPLQVEPDENVNSDFILKSQDG